MNVICFSRNLGRGCRDYLSPRQRSFGGLLAVGLDKSAGTRTSAVLKMTPCAESVVSMNQKASERKSTAVGFLGKELHISATEWKNFEAKRGLGEDLIFGHPRYA